MRIWNLKLKFQGKVNLWKRWRLQTVMNPLRWEGVCNASIGSDNGLAPNRRQAIIWTNNGIVYWPIYARLATMSYFRYIFSTWHFPVTLGSMHLTPLIKKKNRILTVMINSTVTIKWTLTNTLAIKWTWINRLSMVIKCLWINKMAINRTSMSKSIN